LGGTRIINGYGPTEGTTFSCSQRIEESELEYRSIAIGGPITNSRVYILDEEMEVAPVGITGERYVGGDGRGRGYRGKAEVTGEKFIPNGFSKEGGARLYRTGDICRYRGDGRIEYVGRRDGQVKVRGYRIELGEIEAVLRGQPGVAAAAVVMKEGEEGGRIEAFIVGGEGGPSAAEVRSYLRQKLPEYMMPGAVVELAELPMTVNGKVDRRKLNEVEQEQAGEEEGAGRATTAIEELVVGIWEEVLKRE